MLKRVSARICAACARASRDPATVKLVAVTKGHDVAEIKREILANGHTVLGENRVQEWRGKHAILSKEALTVEWHMLGNLQRNKVKYCLPFSLIHSLNSAKLADELERVGQKKGHTFRTLVEVNVAGEASKRGAGLDEAERLVDYARTLNNVQVEGLMAMAPYNDDPEASRPIFVKLHTLRDRLMLRELSMGMSGDFEVAVEEGATIIRVGSAIFSSPSEEMVRG